MRMFVFYNDFLSEVHFFLSGNNIEKKKVHVQWCVLSLCLQNLYSGGLETKYRHMRQDAQRRSINRFT